MTRKMTQEQAVSLGDEDLQLQVWTDVTKEFKQGWSCARACSSANQSVCSELLHSCGLPWRKTVATIRENGYTGCAGVDMTCSWSYP